MTEVRRDEKTKKTKKKTLTPSPETVTSRAARWDAVSCVRTRSGAPRAKPRRARAAQRREESCRGARKRARRRASSERSRRVRRWRTPRARRGVARVRGRKIASRRLGTRARRCSSTWRSTSGGRTPSNPYARNLTEPPPLEIPDEDGCSGRMAVRRGDPEGDTCGGGSGFYRRNTREKAPATVGGSGDSVGERVGVTLRRCRVVFDPAARAPRRVYARTRRRTHGGGCAREHMAERSTPRRSGGEG